MITHNQQPGHGKINVICVCDISDAVSLRNDRVRFFYYGQCNADHIILCPLASASRGGAGKNCISRGST